MLRLFLLTLILTIALTQQENCTNSYFSVNSICTVGGNPGCCNQTATCVLNNLSALITQNSTGQYYILCIILEGNLNITNSTEVIEGALNIQGLNINIENCNMTVQVSEQYLNISQFFSAFNIMINGSKLVFNYLAFLPGNNLLVNSTSILGFTSLNVSEPGNFSLSNCVVTGQQFLVLMAA